MPNQLNHEDGPIHKNYSYHYCYCLNLVKSSVTPAMADTRKYLTLPANADGSINVNISKMPESMDVNIKNVDRSAFYYVIPIPVKVLQ